MKANELMIGDWVQKLEVGGHYRKGQIKAIIDDNVDVATSDGEIHTLSVNGIEPIPLTIGILEQNGFKFNDGMFNWFRNDEDSYYTAFESVRIDVRSGFMRVLKENKDGKQKEVRCDCSGYVHELQHALKLCGIDKEIEL